MELGLIQQEVIFRVRSLSGWTPRTEGESVTLVAELPSEDRLDSCPQRQWEGGEGRRKLISIWREDSVVGRLVFIMWM